ncbi:MAG: phage recombination protein Bet [Variovorax sp.]
MSTALATQQGSALALNDDELIDVLTSSLYPGAARQSVKMVLGYCRAAGLDPMQKPVHIVPMWNSKEGRMVDVVMPGVGLYRTQASRTGQFAGQTEPEFGPMLTEKIGGAEITFPEWARVTVKKRTQSGQVDEFVAVEYWMENYAVKGGKEKSVAPNAMWTKRPRGQIAKCAAAQALRLAFPEMGAAPTAEEMEGKTLYEEGSAVATRDASAVVVEEKTVPPYPADKFDANLVAWRKVIAEGRETAERIILKAQTKGALTEQQKAAIRAPITAATQADADGVIDVQNKKAGAPAVTFAQVASAMNAARTEDALNEAAALIAAVADPAHQTELKASFEARLNALKNKE